MRLFLSTHVYYSSCETINKTSAQLIIIAAAVKFQNEKPQGIAKSSAEMFQWSNFNYITYLFVNRLDESLCFQYTSDELSGVLHY